MTHLTDLDKYGLSCFLAGDALMGLVAFVSLHLALYRLMRRTRRLSSDEARAVSRVVEREGRP